MLVATIHGLFHWFCPLPTEIALLFFVVACLNQTAQLLSVYLIGLTNPSCQKRVLPFSSHIGAYLIGLTNLNCRKWVLPFSSYIGACLIGLTNLNCRKQVLPFITWYYPLDCQLHFSLIWTYPQLPVKLILIHLLGLISECQFDCALTLSHMFTWCQTCFF